MLTKIIALPIALLILPAYYRWYHQQERAQQRYAAQRRYLQRRQAVQGAVCTIRLQIGERLLPDYECMAAGMGAALRAARSAAQDVPWPGPDGR